MSHESPLDTAEPRANTALGVSALAVLLYVVAMILDERGDYGWLWPVAGLVGGAGAVMGWQAGRPRPRGRALLAVVLGGLVLLSIVGWIVVAAINGDL
ncbi:MAG TPA: hypothetical protein VNA12_04895 [Mycobacteriales bacterium]|nr:hypothetical protein [Mycobacteriales bacterium]